MSRSVLSVFFFSPLNSFHTRELSWLCQSFCVYIKTTCISHNPALLSLHAACLLVKAEWITGWSHRGVMWLVEMILHRERTVVQDDNLVIFFFFFVWTRCIVVPQFIPPRPQVGGVRGVRSRMEWRTCFLSLQWERENETEREKVLPIRPSIRVLSTHSSTPPNPGAAAMPIGEQEERGGAGSTDQGSVAISQCIDQWSGAVSGSSPSSPLHLPQSPPPQHTSFNAYQSSRTCRQRCPPLALHCQRMMQQRHRRWPPPCTEGGGVTGAK